MVLFVNGINGNNEKQVPHHDIAVATIMAYIGGGGTHIW